MLNKFKRKVLKIGQGQNNRTVDQEYDAALQEFRKVVNVFKGLEKQSALFCLHAKHIITSSTEYVGLLDLRLSPSPEHNVLWSAASKAHDRLNQHTLVRLDEAINQGLIPRIRAQRERAVAIEQHASLREEARSQMDYQRQKVHSLQETLSRKPAEQVTAQEKERLLRNEDKYHSLTEDYTSANWEGKRLLQKMLGDVDAVLAELLSSFLEIQKTFADELKASIDGEPFMTPVRAPSTLPIASTQAPSLLSPVTPHAASFPPPSPFSHQKSSSIVSNPFEGEAPAPALAAATPSPCPAPSNPFSPARDGEASPSYADDQQFRNPFASPPGEVPEGEPHRPADKPSLPKRPSRPSVTANPASPSSASPTALVCAGCHQPLEAQYLRALGGEWHHGCLRCGYCNKTFSKAFVSKGSVAYCDRACLEQAGKGSPALLFAWSQHCASMCGLIVEDWTRDSWGDGRLFAALVVAYHPEVLQMDMLEHKGQEHAQGNLEVAFAAAQKCGIQIAMRPEDLAHADEHAIQAQVALHYKVLSPQPLANLPEASIFSGKHV
eukprot:g60050.t1